MPKLTFCGYRKEAARRLRSQQTMTEAQLWDHLQNKSFAGYKFRRQFPLGPYFADFCCIGRRLIVELDGEHHALKKKADENRTYYFQQRGFLVLRFWNREVLYNMENVLKRIRQTLNEPFPRPLPPGEGGPRSEARGTGEAS